MFKDIDFKRLTDRDYRNKIIAKYKPKIKKFALPIVIAVCLIAIWISGGIEPTNVANALTNETDYNDNNEVITDDESYCYIDISGEVYNPGVYKVKEGSRIFQVIELAGGLTLDAYTKDLNQAEMISDGQKIYIYSIDEHESDNSSSSSSGITNGKVNINKADLTELQTLPGIGISKAQRIIDYRESTGKFKTIEDIMNVSGIGESTFAGMKEQICV